MPQSIETTGHRFFLALRGGKVVICPDWLFMNLLILDNSPAPGDSCC